MNEARAWIPALVGAAAATLGCVLGLVVALIVPSAPDWVFPVLMAVFGLGFGALAGVTTRRKLRSGRSKL